MRRRNVLGLAGLLALQSAATAVDLVPVRQRARTQACLPTYQYKERAWPFTVPSAFTVSGIAVADTEVPLTPALIEQGLEPRIKTFHFRETALTLNHLRLDHVGIALDRSSRNISATGKIFHDGGDGGLIGSNVIIKLKLYATRPRPVIKDFGIFPSETLSTVRPLLANVASRLPADSVVVWDSTHEFWVPRGGPQDVSLVAPNATWLNPSKLPANFDEITHAEVELQHTRDR